MSARRNPRVELSRESVCALLEPLGSVGDVSPLSSGFANTNLRAQVVGLGSVVVRVVAGGAEALTRELAVMSEAGRLVPVPEVLHSAADHAGHACLVQRFVEGVELQALLRAPETLEPAGQALGAALAALHAREFESAGWLVPADEGLRTQPWDLGQGEEGSETPLSDYARQALSGRAGERLGDEWRGRCAAQLERHAAAFASQSKVASFVHGDFNPSNVILSPDGRSLRAILDWEWAHAGAPLSDLGNLLRARVSGGPPPALVAGVAQGYGDLDPEWRLRARWVDLSSQLEFLGREDEGLALAFDVRRILRGTVAALEAHTVLA